MTRVIGQAATWGALVWLAVAAALAASGRLRPARAAHVIGLSLSALGVGALGWAFATGDLTLAYVAATSDRSTSWPYRIAGLWGGMAGSLLLWSALLAGWGLARRTVDRSERVVLALVPAALLAVVVLWASPWHRLLSPAIDGEGLTPILRHPAMLYHPPLLYLGGTSLVVPFAVVVAGRSPASVRRWLLGAVTALAAAMAAGAHWAYVELGWGGFWAWDPVENTALLPWLAALAALHLLRRPDAAHAARVVATGGGFVLVLLGTTVTRWGAAPSVHAFAEDATVGRALVVVVVAALAVLAWRARSATQPGRVTAAPVEERGDGVDSTRLARNGAELGRPGDADVDEERDRSASTRRMLVALRVQPVLVLFVLVVVLVGTLRPLVGDAAVAVDGSFFAGFVGPVAVVGAALVLAAGAVVPRRLRGARPSHLAHVGFLVLLFGILGSTAGGSAAATLAPGEALTVEGWEVRNDGVSVVEVDGHEAVAADVTMLRDGDVRARLRPALVAYPEDARLLAETSLRSTPLADVQVALRDADDDGRALLEVHVKPLVWWVWWGALLLVAAGAWATFAGVRDDVVQTARRGEELPASHVA